MLNPPVNGKIKELFSSVYSSAVQACAYTVTLIILDIYKHDLPTSVNGSDFTILEGLYFFAKILEFTVTC